MDVKVREKSTGEKKNGALEKVWQESRMPATFEDMERMLDRFFRRMWPSPFRRGEPMFPEVLKEIKPKIDLVERDDEFLVRAEMPGVTKDDVDVSLTEDSVTISGKTHYEDKEEKGEYYRSEISHGEFYRTAYLPSGIDGPKASAKFKDGVLELSLPKLKKSVRHSVKIQEG